MKVIKLILLSLFVSLGSPVFIEAMERDPKKFKTKKTTQAKTKKVKEKASIPALGTLSLKTLKENIKDFDDASKEMLLNNATFQTLCLQNPKECKSIVYIALGLTRKNVRDLADISLNQVFKLYNDRTLGKYFRLKHKLNLLETKYKQKLKSLEEEGYSTDEDLAPAMQKFDDEKYFLEDEIAELLYY